MFSNGSGERCVSKYMDKLPLHAFVGARIHSTAQKFRSWLRV